MRDHDDCEESMNQALRDGKDGFAEYLATRCDHDHGHLHAHPEPADQPEETK